MNTPELVDADQKLANYIAMVIRNAMEDFYCEHLTDDQMKELNPIIRNAIYTGLHALAHYDRSVAARSFADYQRILIPNYWEEPDLLPRVLACSSTKPSRPRI